MSLNNIAQILGQTEHFDNVTHHFAPEGQSGYAKQVDMKRGTTALSHSHPTDHVSVLASGRVLLDTDESDRVELVGPTAVFIKAGLAHAIHAAEDSVWFCVHNISVDDPDVVDDVILGRV